MLLAIPGAGRCPYLSWGLGMAGWNRTNGGPGLHFDTVMAILGPPPRTGQSCRQICLRECRGWEMITWHPATVLDLRRFCYCSQPRGVLHPVAALCLSQPRQWSKSPWRQRQLGEWRRRRRDPPRLRRLPSLPTGHLAWCLGILTGLGG